ncbi:MAG: OmpA family protein, partial [Acidimicrobiia bacterium]|nr:OmpA family protein [Acidimicrobiia bacterium]
GNAAAASELDRRINEIIDRSPAHEEPGDSGGGTVAKAALITIAIGLFAGLIVAFVLSLRSPDGSLSGSVADGTDGGDPASSTVIDEPPAGLAGAITTGTPPTAELLAEEFANALPTAISGRLDLTSLRFEPGTTDLDERSKVVVDDLGKMLADQPALPVTASVRTYTEPTPAENLTLSIAQADALAASLVTAGAAPDQIRARGVGAAPLSQAQPVPNFVALTPRFGDRRLDEALDGHSPFTFGVPATATESAWPLRPDGLLAIGEPAETLSAFPDAEVGAAAYSFLPPSETAVRSEADAAASELGEFLVAAYGVNPDQITTIIPGSAVFVPTSEHGNHIWLQVGPASQGAFDVASIDPADITFEPGSAELDTAGLATVQALADILTSGGATIVVDVRSYDADDAAINLAQSEDRRETLAETLITARVAPEQLRMYASGASSYFLDDGGSAISITVAP